MGLFSGVSWLKHCIPAMKVTEVTCRSKSLVQLFATIGNSEQILYNLTDHDRNKMLIEIKCLVLSCCFISINYSYLYIYILLLLLFPFIHCWFVMYPSVCLEITGKLNYSCPPLVGIWYDWLFTYLIFNWQSFCDLVFKNSTNWPVTACMEWVLMNLY